MRTLRVTQVNWPRPNIMKRHICHVIPSNLTPSTKVTITMPLVCNIRITREHSKTILSGSHPGESDLIGLGWGPGKDAFWKHPGDSTTARLKTPIYNIVSMLKHTTQGQLLGSGGAVCWIQICVGSEFGSVITITLTRTLPLPPQYHLTTFTAYSKTEK